MNEKILLKDHGLKATPSRLSILHYLSTLDAPITAEELFRRLQSQGLDLSTLYRNLNTFVEAGLAKREGFVIFFVGYGYEELLWFFNEVFGRG